MAAEGIDGHDWVRVCRLEDLPTDGGGLAVEVGRRHVAVFRVGEELFAVDDSCPHQGGSLGLGVVLDGEVTCPWHGLHFCLSTGRNTDGVDAPVRVRKVRATAEGDVEVGTPSKAAK